MPRRRTNRSVMSQHARCIVRVLIVWAPPAARHRRRHATRASHAARVSSVSAPKPRARPNRARMRHPQLDWRALDTEIIGALRPKPGWHGCLPPDCAPPIMVLLDGLLTPGRWPHQMYLMASSRSYLMACGVCTLSVELWPPGVACASSSSESSSPSSRSLLDGACFSLSSSRYFSTMTASGKQRLKRASLDASRVTMERSSASISIFFLRVSLSAVAGRSMALMRSVSPETTAFSSCCIFLRGKLS
mmetsp:Transcript_68656/g.188313  ORF Transcript_68656/g.188313 Transcript_68656/m.188313 type:complete len:247 (-) Transcript_68656:4302-5042(-)